MNLFQVYPLQNITPVKAENCWLWDDKGEKYLDLYGGHAVISVGHSHPHYVKELTKQLNQIGFYSNSVVIPQQEELAEKLGKISGYKDYSLFLCNSGAEANENALKLASFHNCKKKVITFSKSFHGRTSAAVAATDNKSIVAPINETDNFIFVELNNEEALEKVFLDNEISSVIIEGIQGIGGVYFPTESFFKKIQSLCKEHRAVFICDEIQSGYGRSGKFFAHQYHENIKPDIISIAKGMGNGFPVGGILISPEFKAQFGMLGTTFGGNYLACAASIAVLDIIENENLVENAKEVGDYFVEQLVAIPQIKEVRSQGLMTALEFDFPVAELRKKLSDDYHILTGTASGKNVMRILPSLTVSKNEIDLFIEALKKVLN